MELNTRCSEGYRRYSSDVPKYLHNKPRPFVNHCRQRIISAVEVEPQHIKEVCNGIEDGQFQVQSQSSNTWYSLSFGAGDVTPQCSCPDFCHTGLLCKHFFAIFDHYPKWQWGSLPEKYRENPHLSLDREHVFADFTKYKSGEENHNIQIGQDVPGNQQDGKAGVPNQKVKGIDSQIRQEAVTCREKLKGLTSLTYNIEDVSALKELNSSLEMLLIKFTTFQTTDEKENSLQIQTLIKKQSGKKQLKSSFGNYLPLPACCAPQEKRFHNRVGEFASMMQKHYKVQIPVDGVSVKTPKTKSSLKRKKELHKESKHPSPPKKQRTEEQNHLVQNETKTSNHPSAAQERTDTPPTNTQHPNSEDQPLQKEIPVFSSAVSNSPSTTVSNSPSSAVSNSPSSTVSNSPSSAVGNSPSSKVSNSPSSAVGDSPSSKVSNNPSSAVSNSPSSTVSNRPSSAVSNSPSAAVSNGQFGDSSTPSNKSTPGPIIIDENSPDPPSWLTIEL